MSRSSWESDWARISPAALEYEICVLRDGAWTGRLTKDDHTGSTVSALLVLRPTQFNHVLRGWMCDVDLAENSVPVICEPIQFDTCEGSERVEWRMYSQNSTHRIQNHFEHGFGA